MKTFRNCMGMGLLLAAQAQPLSRVLQKTLPPRSRLAR